MGLMDGLKEFFDVMYVVIINVMSTPVLRLLIIIPLVDIILTVIARVIRNIRRK